MKKFLKLLSPKSLGHLLVSLMLLAGMSTANAADQSIVGTWKLVSMQATDVATGVNRLQRMGRIRVVL